MSHKSSAPPMRAPGRSKNLLRCGDGESCHFPHSAWIDVAEAVPGLQASASGAAAGRRHGARFARRSPGRAVGRLSAARRRPSVAYLGGAAVPWTRPLALCRWPARIRRADGGQINLIAYRLFRNCYNYTLEAEAKLIDDQDRAARPYQ